MDLKCSLCQEKFNNIIEAFQHNPSHHKSELDASKYSTSSCIKCTFSHSNPSITKLAAIVGLIWITFKMRNNVYFKRKQSLISSLAGLKSEYKTKMDILKTQQDVQEAHVRNP